MAVLRLNNEEYGKFPTVMRDYASYMAAIRGNAEKTVCEYLLDLRTFFRWYLVKNNGNDKDFDNLENVDISGITLSDAAKVTAEDVISFIMYASLDRNNSTTTRKRKLSALRSFFGYLHGKKHLIDKDPTADVEGPKAKKTLPKYLDLSECLQLLETVKSDSSSKTVLRDYAIISLFLNTGMRVSELAGLNIKDFDADFSYVKVLGKGSKERVLYLNHAASESIKEYVKDRLSAPLSDAKTDALFLSARLERISVKTVQWMVYKYLDLAGLGNRGLSVHKLRHTAATLMYQSGKVDVRVLKDILGHEQLNTTQIYTHVVNRNIEDAVKNNPLADMEPLKK